MEDLELGIFSNDQARQILFGDHDELHDIVRGVDWKFDGCRIYVCGSGV